METPIRILMLEDAPEDAELTQRELVRAGIAFTARVVQTKAEFVTSLSEFAPSIVLSDHSLPMMDGITALQLSRQISPEVPFIFVTGSMGEERAIELLRTGATDYVLKHRLSRLAPAVERALQEAEDRAKRHQIAEALRASQEQLRQAQKMEALGALAGGVAHDFNNLLNVIIGYSEIALMKLRSEDPLRDGMEQIRRAGEQAAGLTRQLLAFSRRQVLEPRILNLNNLVSEIEKMLRRLIRKDIEFVTVLGTDLEPIKADPGQVEQVIMNLVVNARDAMPDGGKLILETGNAILDEYFAQQCAAVHAGAYVRFAVTDTGVGMTEDVQARIFEPFFTTKGEGKGTGLGLSTVYGIVKQCEATVRVMSQLGHGSTFEIYFPAVQQAVERTGSSVEPICVGGTEVILVVEDDEGIRNLLRECLDGYGYTVQSTWDPAEALQILRRSHTTIHLLITDLIMPGMNGQELARHAKALDTDLRVLYMSGHIGDGLVEEGAAFLQKPFALTTVARKVREVLDAGDAQVLGVCDGAQRRGGDDKGDPS